MNEEKSKSQLKREATSLQDLGIKFSQLSMSQLEQLPLPVELLEAVVRMKKIKSQLAKKRQAQFVGKIMRSIDNIESIEEAYNKIVNAAKFDSTQFHSIEKWRARLVSDENNALTEFLKQYSCDDIQQLRVLIRKAKRENSQGKNLGASKALFRLMRDLMK